MYTAESGTLDISFKNSITILGNGVSTMFLTFVTIRELGHSMENGCRFRYARRRVTPSVNFHGGKGFPSRSRVLESWLISTAEKQMLNHKEYYKSRGGACALYRQHLTIKETTM